MPSSEIIAAGLAQIANRAFALAVVAHFVLGLIGVAVALGIRPARGVALSLVSVLLASVGVVALLFRNPFNAGMFALLAGAYAYAALSSSAPHERAQEPTWTRAVGFCLLVFGWTYPHFLEDASPFAYLIGAPLGLVPCPTLAFSVGLALTGLVPTPVALSCALGLYALFYGLFGALRLGVALDLVLLLGGLVLLLRQLQFRHPRSLITP